MSAVGYLIKEALSAVDRELSRQLSFADRRRARSELERAKLQMLNDAIHESRRSPWGTGVRDAVRGGLLGGLVSAPAAMLTGHTPLLGIGAGAGAVAGGIGGAMGPSSARKYLHQISRGAPSYVMSDDRLERKKFDPKKRQLARRLLRTL